MPKFIRWIPTRTGIIDTFFEICPVSSSDVIYDLGSGDGRLLFKALEKGAGRCVGIDIDTERIKNSREEAEKRGLTGKVTFIESDVLDVDLSEASVILCYLNSSASAVLAAKFEKELRPGTKIVMEIFSIPGWKPVKSIKYNDSFFRFYLYTMPAEKSADREGEIKVPIDGNGSFNYYSDDF
jgi:SAM-dependent methyltransferase